METRNGLTWLLCGALREETEFHIIKNQQLLKEYHLSQPNFDTISEIASQFQFGAKLTDFAGGFAYIVLRPNLTDVEIQHLQEQFSNRNFTTKIATIDCDGVTIDN